MLNPAAEGSMARRRTAPSHQSPPQRWLDGQKPRYHLQKWGETMEKPWKKHGKTMEHQHPIAFSTFFFPGVPASSILHTIEASARRCAPAFFGVEEVDQVAPLR